MRREAAERRRQGVDGVVGPRHRGVPAFVLRGQREGDVLLLGRLQREGHASRAPPFHPAGVRVERVVGRAQPRPRLEQPADAAGGGRFLVAGEHHDEVARRDEALTLPAHHVRHQHRGACLVVHRAAAHEPAVLLAEHERVELPVLALGRDDVEMGQQQYRPSRRVLAAECGHHVHARGVRPDRFDVRRRVPGCRQPRCHRPCGRRHAAAFWRGIDLHQLAEDLPMLLIECGRLRTVPPALTTASASASSAITR